MSATHDTFADDPIDWKSERDGFLGVINTYVHGADMPIVRSWPTHFLQRMGTATASWWDAQPEYRWQHILFHAKREGLHVPVQ